jgi:ATPase subunit of ABC transporter with duplicated ATPase domains
VQSRIKALDKIEKIELPKRRVVVKFDFRDPPRSGDQVAVIEHLSKSYGKRVIYDDFSLTIRRGERWAVMGRNGAGKTTLLKILSGNLTPDVGEVRLGASLKMGYFAQQSLDVLDADLTIIEQLQIDFPREGLGALRSLAGAFQFSGDDVDKKIRRCQAARNRARDGADAVRSAELPGPRRADQPPRPGHEGNAGRFAQAFEGTMIFVSHDRTFLRGLGSRVLELGGESGVDAHPHAYPGSYIEYVDRTGHEAPGIHS